MKDTERLLNSFCLSVEAFERCCIRAERKQLHGGRDGADPFGGDDEALRPLGDYSLRSTGLSRDLLRDGRDAQF